MMNSDGQRVSGRDGAQQIRWEIEEMRRFSWAQYRLNRRPRPSRGHKKSTNNKKIITHKLAHGGEGRRQKAGPGPQTQRSTEEKNDSVMIDAPRHDSRGAQRRIAQLHDKDVIVLFVISHGQFASEEGRGRRPRNRSASTVHCRGYRQGDTLSFWGHTEG